MSIQHADELLGSYDEETEKNKKYFGWSIRHGLISPFEYVDTKAKQNYINKSKGHEKVKVDCGSIDSYVGTIKPKDADKSVP